MRRSRCKMLRRMVSPRRCSPIACNMRSVICPPQAAIAALQTSISAPRELRSAARSGGRRTPAAGASPAPMPGRPTCGAKRTPSIGAGSCRSPRASNSKSRNCKPAGGELVSHAVTETQHAKTLAALAQHLRARRDTLLEGWRKAVDADPHLTTASTLSKAQFIDHIPQMLDTFERRLTAESYPEKRAAVEEQKEGAAAHGLQRWQQGYNQRETARDWGHLQLCLLAELEDFE